MAGKLKKMVYCYTNQRVVNFNRECHPRLPDIKIFCNSMIFQHVGPCFFPPKNDVSQFSLPKVRDILQIFIDSLLPYVIVQLSLKFH